MMYQCSKKLVKYKEYTVVLTILTFRYIQYLHLMYAEVAWVLVYSGTQVQRQLLLDSDFQTIFPFLMTMVQLKKIVPI